MEIAAIIISTIALVLSIANLIFILAKHFSTHSIQYVNPFEDMTGKKSKDPMDEFKEIGEPKELGDD